MTPVRQRMIEDMRLRGFSARTQESCVSAVRHIATDFHVSPDRLTGGGPVAVDGRVDQWGLFWYC